MPTPKLTVMVSSTVYGKETLLEQIYAVLQNMGYRVWMSKNGSLPILPHKNAFESCLAAVEKCDIFFGLITPNYGSGVSETGGLAITHLELLKALELKIPRFMLAHENVILARRLLMDLGYETEEQRRSLKLKKGSVIVDDIRLIEMYEAATLAGMPMIDRVGNWVQPYKTSQDALSFVETQFGDYDSLKSFIDQKNEELAESNLQ
jgi:hypothetical protein